MAAEVVGDRRGFHNNNVTYFMVRAYSGIRRTMTRAMTRPYDRSAMAAPTTESTVASTTNADRRWRPDGSTVRRLALASLVANIGIVATGGLVRLTNSGLGCPTWPRCEKGDFVPTKKLSWHGAVEFGNRMLIGIVLVAAVAVFVAAVRQRDAGPAAAAIRRWAWVTLLGVPAQIVMGGLVTLTNLNPWVVAAHFMLSMLLDRRKYRVVVAHPDTCRHGSTKSTAHRAPAGRGRVGAHVLRVRRRHAGYRERPARG